MVAMATTLFTVYCKLFHMMPYIIILKVRKFHQPTASRFRTARKKPVGGPSLNRVNEEDIKLIPYTISNFSPILQSIVRRVRGVECGLVGAV